MRALLIAFSILAGGLSSANAQIYQCKDEKGQLLLSDRPCASGKLLSRQRTAEENMQDDIRAYQATIEKEERRAKENARNMARQEQQQREMRAYRAPQVSGLENYKGYEERLAERNASVKPTLTPYHEAKRQRRMRDSSGDDTFITHCSGNVCFDQRGNTFTHAGGNTVVGPDGQVCAGSGTAWGCN
ncbi:DUF4124 domain-containing protein [Comamonas sp. J-3]|uniref:DUF4124 domain-containing protein n=1 Tax=Comamonas trifloxystrobinivorans TaxID=3350256 RepID=UPI00372AAB33